VYHLEIRHLGRLSYALAYQSQAATLDRVLASRESADPITGVILTVEHDPVITVSRRAGAADHIIASRELLASMGITIEETDRGGDITYHGPGQQVVYPILDLNALNLGLHAYMRLLEQTVMDTCATFGVPAQRDTTATGVWVMTDPTTGRLTTTHTCQLAKLCAMGVRVRRWISMHGLAINVTTDLRHFATIVPCGLHNRPVCSLQSLLGSNAPTIDEVRATLVTTLSQHIEAQYNTAASDRAARTSS
jgi:lipoyl(octanoyl) transferase